MRDRKRGRHGPCRRQARVLPTSRLGRRRDQPYSVLSYTNEALHRRETRALLLRGHWCYVGLEAEIPNPGDFKRTVGRRALGDHGARRGRRASTSSRTSARIAACSFCRERHGNARTSPARTTSGTTRSRATCRACRSGAASSRTARSTAACRPTSSRADHGLTKLKVAARGGVVFASFDPRRRVARGLPRPGDPRATSIASSTAAQLKILGYNRQRIPGNWKLMQENIKDPYHPGLLHTWFVTFGLWRADNKSQLVMDERHRHAAMISTPRTRWARRRRSRRRVELQGRHEAQGPALPRHRAEPWWGGPTAVMTTIFPSVIFQQQVN